LNERQELVLKKSKILYNKTSAVASIQGGDIAMSKKEWVLIGLVLALGGLYAAYFGDWFRPKFIRIEHTARWLRSGFGGPGRSDASQPSMSITFSLGRSYRLTSLRVVLAAKFQTNRFAHYQWLQ